MYSSRIPSSTDLQILRACGAIRFETDSGPLWAIFDDAFMADIDDHIEGTGPRLSACRSCDIERLGIRKDSVLILGDRSYRVDRVEPDGTGISVVILKG